MQISGSSAIVVGGAGGLGEATVRRLVAAGAKVVVADVADEKGKALEQELDVRYVRTDATDEADVRTAMAEAQALGPLRISVDAHGGPAIGGRLVGIRVVTIAPGTFLTPAYGKAGDQLEAYWGPQIPYPKRMGRPAEYAAMVQSICENDYLNGEVIRLDGALRFPPK